MSQAIQQPRDEQGRFVSPHDLSSEKTVEVQLSEFECRVIGHRMLEASDRYGDMSNCRLDQECREWAQKLLDKCQKREENDEEYYEQGKKRHVDAVYTINVSLTEFEAWMIGNRLWEVGEKYGIEGYQYIESETKWWARRFHAERDED